MNNLVYNGSLALFFLIGAVAGHFHGKSIVYEGMFKNFAIMTDINTPRSK